MNFFLGIDPGKSGAFALLDQEGQFLEGHHCPEFPQEMAQALKNYQSKVSLAVLEAVHAFPGQGTKSMFNFGKNYGIWIGLLSAYMIPYQLITPIKWQRLVLDSQRQDGHLAFAKRRWPSAPLIRKKDEAIAAALCLASCARMIHFGIEPRLNYGHS